MHRNLSEIFWVVFYPLAVLWACVTSIRRRFFNRGYQSRLPVLCVGNIHSGGSGKTPVVVEIVKHFSQLNPVVLSRGYGRNLKAVNPGPEQLGDEPWMIQQETNRTVLVAKNRGDLARKVETENLGSLLVLDDGFQNFTLRKNVNIVCVHVDKKITELNCLPLGELREGMGSLRDATAVLLVGEEASFGHGLWRTYFEEEWEALPVFNVKTSYEAPSPHGKYLAFCGIAAPDRFKATLESFHFDFEFVPFRDHHRYTERDVEGLLERASKHETDSFITTQKDYYKCVELFKKYKKNLQFVKMSAQIEDHFWTFIDKKIKQA